MLEYCLLVAAVGIRRDDSCVMIDLDNKNGPLRCTADSSPREREFAVGTPIAERHRVTGGGRPPPVPTERSVQISRTTLFRR
jgi:hypothetical protein